MELAEAMRGVLVTGALLAVIAAGCGSTKTVTVTRVTTTVRTVTTTKTTTSGSGQTAAPCSDADLKGSFDVVPGSPGAGQISYTLTMTNTSSAPCTVSGTPDATLLDKNGAMLPTHILAVQAGQGAAGAVVLQPGASAKTDARFSPDVPGTGDAQSGPCEPTAHVLRVTAPGGGTVDAPINPPTPVCERGTLSFSAFTAAP